MIYFNIMIYFTDGGYRRTISESEAVKLTEEKYGEDNNAMNTLYQEGTVAVDGGDLYVEVCG